MEPYGLPAGTNINYKALGFPQWVDTLCAQWGLDSSTYAGHQEGDRPDIGAAPNPGNLNRGIDWAGDPQRMLDFAHWLVSIGPARQPGVYGPPGIEMIIYQDPRTGEQVGYPGFVDYSGDFGGHTDHVHTRFSAAVIDVAPSTVMTVPLVQLSERQWTSPSPAWAHLIMRESGGDPTIIQQIIDVNSGGNEAEGMFQIAGCVPLDTEILTRRGVLRHDEVQVGDLTVGYNPKTGRSQWTRIVRVMHYDSGEIFRIGRGKWQAEITADHRWATFRPSREESLTSCPECGWVGNPRTGSPPTGRSVSTHMGRAHGSKQSTPDPKGKFEMVESARLKQHHSILLAAPARTGLDLPISEQEASILGWILTDGHIRKASEDTHRGPTSYAACIYQSKPLQVATLEALLSDIPHTQSSRLPRGMATMPQYSFRLRTPWVTELVKRAELDIDNPVGFVLKLSEHQRTAFLNAVIAAEGCSEDGLTRIAQVDGPMQDAIAIAVYLSGYHPSFSRINAASTNVSAAPKPIGHIGMTRPYRSTGGAARRQHKGYPAMATTGRREPVWCVETELGTWTMRQGKRIMLTGNSTWRAHGGDEFAPSARLATPQQQAIVAARIFTANPSGSDWGAGLPGREDPSELAAGLVPLAATPQPGDDMSGVNTDRLNQAVDKILQGWPSRSMFATDGNIVEDMDVNVDGNVWNVEMILGVLIGVPYCVEQARRMARGEFPSSTRVADDPWLHDLAVAFATRLVPLAGALKPSPTPAVPPQPEPAPSPIPQPAGPKPIAYCVNGFGGDMWTGLPADVGHAIEDRYYFQPVGYSSNAFPLGIGRDSGVTELTRLIGEHQAKDPGRGFVLVGFSLGAVIVDDVFDVLRSGELQRFWPCFLGGVKFGDPRREAGVAWDGPHRCPPGIPPGVGIAGSNNLKNTPDNFRSYVYPVNWGDIYTNAGMTPAGTFDAGVAADCELVYDMVMTDWDGSLLGLINLGQKLLTDFGSAGLDVIMAVFNGLQFLTQQQAPHMQYKTADAVSFLRSLT